MLRGRILFRLQPLLVSPRPVTDEVVQNCSRAVPVPSQQRLVDPPGHILTQGRLKEFREGWREVLHREDQQSHCAFKVGQELRVCGSPGGEVCRGKVEGRRDVSVIRGNGNADELDELQPKQGEMEGGVVVQKLELIVSGNRFKRSRKQRRDGSGVCSD